MSKNHKVVIVGGGFGGLYCARALCKAPVQVTLLDRRNFHLFQPLLYQVATGGLSPANIAAPLRSVLKRQKNCTVLLGEVVDFDMSAKTVILSDASKVSFDTLVLAGGSTHHYYGHDNDWQPLAPGLKTVEDATEIRARVLSAFEQAEREENHDARSSQLTFVVIGGGPTGVEIAGAIAELARYTLRSEFRRINPAFSRVVLVECQTRLLTSFHEKLSKKALNSLARMGVEVMLGTHVKSITNSEVHLVNANKQESSLQSTTIIWAAGVKASPLGELLAKRASGLELDRSGRVVVSCYCSVPGYRDLFVIGDMALFNQSNGKPLPGLAPVAMQQGRYVADVIDRRLRNLPMPLPFKYWDKGNMATIGRSHAVAETKHFRLSGLIAWLAWLLVHIMYLAKFENRVLVMFQWLWNYLTRNRAARLITRNYR